MRLFCKTIKKTPMKKIMYLFALLLSGTVISKAQTGALNLSNITFYEQDTASSQVTVRFNVDCNNISALKTLTIQLGTKDGSSDVLSVSAPIVFLNNVYYVQYQGTNYPISGNRITLSLKLPTSQHKKMKFVTTYGEGKDSKLTSKVKYNKLN